MCLHSTDRQIWVEMDVGCSFHIMHDFLNFVLERRISPKKVLHISIVKPTRCTNESNYFILDWHSTCFGRSFRPSSGVQHCTYSNKYMSNRYCCLLASRYIGASDWFYYRNKLQCTALWMSNSFTYCKTGSSYSVLSSVLQYRCSVRDAPVSYKVLLLLPSGWRNKKFLLARIVLHKTLNCVHTVPYFALCPTNAHLSHKLSHFYLFRYYCVILRELVINTVRSYMSISYEDVCNTI